MTCRGFIASGYPGDQFMEYADYRKLIPKMIDHGSYALDSGQSIRIEDLFIVTNLSVRRSVVFYLSERVRLDRVNTRKIADSIDRTWSKKTFHRLGGKHRSRFPIWA